MDIADVIILSDCRNEKFFRMNQECISSLIESEPQIHFDICIIESYKKWPDLNLKYDWENVKVIVPEENFNFNRSLNIGIKTSSNEIVTLANNDLIFHKHWLSEILEVREHHPEILSFCPFDRTSKYLKWENFNKRKFIRGYRVPIEFVGWCVVVDRSVFSKIGLLDETFDLYFQDNDFALTLKQHRIPHALVPQSFVQHLGGATTEISDPSKTEKYRVDKQKFYKKWNLNDRKSLLRSFVGRFLK